MEIKNKELGIEYFSVDQTSFDNAGSAAPRELDLLSLPTPLLFRVSLNEAS